MPYLQVCHFFWVKFRHFFFLFFFFCTISSLCFLPHHSFLYSLLTRIISTLHSYMSYFTILRFYIGTSLIIISRFIHLRSLLDVSYSYSADLYWQLLSYLTHEIILQVSSSWNDQDCREIHGSLLISITFVLICLLLFGRFSPSIFLITGSLLFKTCKLLLI